MTSVITTRIVNIGNSRGIRIPQLLLDRLEPVEEVELTIEQDRLVVRPIRHVRRGGMSNSAGWRRWAMIVFLIPIATA